MTRAHVVLLATLVAVLVTGCGGKKAAAPKPLPPVCSLLTKAEVAAVFHADSVRTKGVRETAGPACIWISEKPPRGFELTYDSHKGSTPADLWVAAKPDLNALTCLNRPAGWNISGAYVDAPTILLRATDFGQGDGVKKDVCRLLPLALKRLAAATGISGAGQ